MRPDWKIIEVGDALYDAQVEKWACDAYGRDMTTMYVGPYNLDIPGRWTIARVPDTNEIGSRIVVSKV